MYSREQFQRLSELRDYSIGLQSPHAYFCAADDKFIDPWKLQRFAKIERELQGLGDEAWTALKAEALPLLQASHPFRKWQPLFDKLREAKAYNYLVRRGCECVRFIPRSQK